MARQLTLLCGYRVGPSNQNLTAPRSIAYNPTLDKYSITQLVNNGQRWGSVLKPTFRPLGVHKAMVFETPNQIATLIDPTIDGADAALTVNAAGNNTQAGATADAGKFYNKCTVVATDVTDGVQLPAAVAGTVRVYSNQGAGTLKLWPINGGTDKIESQAANTSKSYEAGKIVTFACFTTGVWKTMNWN